MNKLLIITILLMNFYNVYCQTDTLYNQDTKIIEVGNLNKDGEREGIWTTYFENGKIESSGLYNKNEKLGKWIWYYDSGEICGKEKYINDKIKKGKYWDKEGKRISASDLIIKPEYSGGMDAFRHMVAENLVYPSLAEENGIHGKVYVEFVISKNGERTKPKVIGSVDPLLDQEALRVINLSDKWKPGTFHGKEILVSITCPVNFVLQ